jgi:hypothetical protein
MKKQVLLVAALLVGVASYGQGTFNYNNLSGAGTVVQVGSPSGAGEGVMGDYLGSEYSVGFYWVGGSVADDASFLAANPALLGGSVVSFYGNTGQGASHGPTVDGAGYFDGGIVGVPGQTGTISGELFVWFNNGGAFTTYDQALAAGVNTGRSALMNIALATGTTTPLNLNQVGLQNFTVAAPVPEPTTLALAGLGGFGMLMALRRKKA